MNQLNNALGSIHVRHNKNTENEHSVPIKDPDVVSIPMSMHIGAPCGCCFLAGIKRCCCQYRNSGPGCVRIVR